MALPSVRNLSIMPRPSRPRSVAPRQPRPAPQPRSLWKHGRLPVVGLIGGIGAGKSQVASDLTALGAFVIDADKVGHALLDQRPARGEVVSRFGPEVLDPADPEKVDRKVLGRIVFADFQARRDLEAILHPRMRQTFLKVISRVLRRREGQAIVLDAAILLESGWDDLCDLVLFVDAPDDQRLERVRTHRGWSAEDLEVRERAQWPNDRKRARADAIVMNDADEATLKVRVEAFWRSLMGRRRERSRLGFRPDSAQARPDDG